MQAKSNSHAGSASCASSEKPVSSGLVLITGGLGRVALGVAANLKKWHRIVLSDRLATAEALPILKEAGLDPEAGEFPIYRETDLADFPSVLRGLEGIASVVHLAVVPAVAFRDRTMPAPDALDSWDETVLRVNPLLTHHILEACHRKGIRRVVNGSSLTVQLGNLERPRFAEEDPADPQSLYACSKLAGETLGQFYTERRNLPVYSLRIGQPYPVSSRPAEEWRTSARARSVFVTMGDIARGIHAALTTNVAPGVFNLVSESDNPRVDQTRARSMGYIPMDKFTGEGIWHREGEDSPWQLSIPV